MLSLMIKILFESIYTSLVEINFVLMSKSKIIGKLCQIFFLSCLEIIYLNISNLICNWLLFFRSSKNIDLNLDYIQTKINFDFENVLNEMEKMILTAPHDYFKINKVESSFDSIFLLSKHNHDYKNQILTDINFMTYAKEYVEKQRSYFEMDNNIDISLLFKNLDNKEISFVKNSGETLYFQLIENIKFHNIYIYNLESYNLENIKSYPDFTHLFNEYLEIFKINKQDFQDNSKIEELFSYKSYLKSFKNEDFKSIFSEELLNIMPIKFFFNFHDGLIFDKIRSVFSNNDLIEIYKKDYNVFIESLIKKNRMNEQILNEQIVNEQIVNEQINNITNLNNYFVFEHLNISPYIFICIAFLIGLIISLIILLTSFF